MKTNSIAEKITLLNKIVLDSMLEKSDRKIIENFTKAGIDILGADYGWAWWKFKDKEEYELTYKSPNLPFTPDPPRHRAGNYTAIKTKRPFFNNKVRNEKYKVDLGKYMQSYIIIPISYGNKVYGTFDLCYGKRNKLSSDEMGLAQALGNAAAQAITIHRYLETDILFAQEKLKNEFIANTTHEFRTPLTIMRGHIYLANKKNDLKSAKSALREIDAEIVNLSELLSDLVLITAGKAQKTRELVPVNVAEVAYRAADKLKIYASKEKHVKISRKGGVGGAFVQGDEKYLERVFLNLIRNAITYGGKNIEVSVETKKGSVAVHVKDDGMGIGKDDLQHIFERFFRADKSHNRSDGHSGLGLPIAKWIVEDVHHGKISVKSSEGIGSTFTVIIPKAKGKLV